MKFLPVGSGCWDCDCSSADGLGEVAAVDSASSAIVLRVQLKKINNY